MSTEPKTGERMYGLSERLASRRAHGSNTREAECFPGVALQRVRLVVVVLERAQRVRRHISTDRAPLRQSHVGGVPKMISDEDA
jgi:hypothetical protein